MRRFIAAGFGTGFVPRRLFGSDKGAGTVGAALAAMISIALWSLPVGVHLAATVGAVLLSLWAPTPFLAEDEDPAWVTIDEVAGTLVALVGLRGAPWLVALVVARVADITKALPGVRAAESLPGSTGVTSDDVIAGGYGLAVGWVLTALL